MKSSKFKVIISTFLVVLLMLVTAVGCSSKSSSVSGSEKESESTKTVKYTDMVGREVELTTDIKKIVAVRYMDIYYLSAILGDELDDKLISLGMSLEKNDIDGYKKFSEVFNLSNLSNIGSIYDDAISLESVIDLNPDIIIVDKQFYEKSCIKKMIEAGLPVVVTDFNTDPIYGAQENVKMIGKMLGKEERVNEMVTYINEKTDGVMERVKKLQDSNVKKPKLYFECGNVSPSEFGGTRGDKSNGWGYIWDKLGADNIGVNNGSNPMNPEQILTADPDVVVIGGANWNPDGNIMRFGFYVTPKQVNDHLELYTQRAGWSDLDAIKNGRLYGLHFNYTVHPYNYAGLEAMAKFLYPEEFSDLNPEGDMKEFFDKYMPVEYSGTFSGGWEK